MPSGSQPRCFRAVLAQGSWFTALLVQIPAGLQLDSLLARGWLVRFMFVVRFWFSDLLVRGSAGSQFSWQHCWFAAVLVHRPWLVQSLAGSLHFWFTAKLTHSPTDSRPCWLAAYCLRALLTQFLAGSQRCWLPAFLVHIHAGPKPCWLQALLGHSPAG